MKQRVSAFLAMACVLGASVAGCRVASEGDGEPAAEVRVDGSSTVYPITEAVAEEFSKANPNARVTVGVQKLGEV